MIKNLKGIGVYALCEPVGGRVRYVGASKRMERHGRAYASGTGNNPEVNAWVADLAERGLRPTILVLEIPLPTEINERRTHWLETCRLLGDADLNMIGKI